MLPQNHDEFLSPSLLFAVGLSEPIVSRFIVIVGFTYPVRWCICVFGSSADISFPEGLWIHKPPPAAVRVSMSPPPPLLFLPYMRPSIEWPLSTRPLSANFLCLLSRLVSPTPFHVPSSLRDCFFSIEAFIAAVPLRLNAAVLTPFSPSLFFSPRNWKSLPTTNAVLYQTFAPDNVSLYGILLCTIKFFLLS